MRILFITATRIGDAVISTGLLRHLVSRYPGAEITIACGPLAQSLFAAVPGLKEVIVLEKKPIGAHWPSLWSKVVPTRWDLIVDLRRSLIPYLVSTKKSARLGPDDRRLHRVEFLSTLFELDLPSTPKIWTTAAHQEKAQELISEESPFIALAPIAARSEKTWPLDHFVTLIQRLTRSDGILPKANAMVIGAEQDRARLEEFASKLDAEHLPGLIGCPDLLTVYSVLARASLVIANDSGIGHLAAATGRPTATLFGPTQPDLYRPWGKSVAVAQAPLSEKGRKMKDLTVGTVFEAIETVLNS